MTWIEHSSPWDKRNSRKLNIRSIELKLRSTDAQGSVVPMLLKSFFSIYVLFFLYIVS